MLTVVDVVVVSAEVPSAEVSVVLSVDVTAVVLELVVVEK